MAVVTQQTEKPGNYESSFAAVKKQMLKNDKIKRKYSDAELEVIIKQSLIEKALDKMEFSLRGEIRRGKPAKMGLGEDEFSDLWKSKMKQRLTADGFPFELTKEEQELLKAIHAKQQKEKAEEMAQITSEAMRKILLNV